MDGKQRNRITTGSSSEETTTPGLSLFLRDTEQSDEPQAAFLVSMLAYPWTPESLQRANLQSNIWHTNSHPGA